MSQQLNDLVIRVNNEQIFYMPETLVFSNGLGENKKRFITSGGGLGETNTAKDLTTRIGKVKFSLPATTESEELKTQWQTNLEGNSVQLIGPAGSNFKGKVFSNATVVNDPETNATTDGTIDVEFETDPAV